MTTTADRTPEQIRSEIAAERAQLDAAINSLETDAKELGRIAGVVLAGVVGLATLRKIARSLRKS